MPATGAVGNDSIVHFITPTQGGIFTEAQKYYEAYDQRYKQVHGKELLWFQQTPSPIVMDILREFGLTPDHHILEIGCGEGRDAYALMNAGYPVLAADVSPEAIRFCKEKFPEFASRFTVLDCLKDVPEIRFDFIYAVAVLHMFVPDEDRDAFYGFIRDSLTDTGICLICAMGDGVMERQTDIAKAFDIAPRVHGETGETMLLSGTSCRMVPFDVFKEEIQRNGLIIRKDGITSVPPDFPVMMYAVVSRK